MQHQNYLKIYIHFLSVYLFVSHTLFISVSVLLIMFSTASDVGNISKATTYCYSEAFLKAASNRLNEKPLYFSIKAVKEFKFIIS